MSASLLVVTGTGTGIGKTHATSAIARAWARALVEAGIPEPKVAALKPVESGVQAHEASDVATLEHASTFHVKRVPPPYMLARAVSPHLAARDEGRTLEIGPIREYVRGAVELAHAVAVELPGGLFTPLAPDLCNADVARALDPDAVLLVAPDRLGVLHDVAASTRAADALGLVLTGIVLVAPDHPDASTGTNAAELPLVTGVPVVATLPRAPAEELAEREDVKALVASLVVRSAKARTTSPRPRPR
ncbi:MAG: Dethiobiotin synthetase [Labilithrix sp.]|nr:Dethiobiotin synthetase [Labilithrix sp.]